MIIYISALSVGKDPQNTTHNILKHLYKDCKLKVSAIRFFLTDKEDKKVMDLCPKAHLIHYDIMAIAL